ncbi:MAG: hypothetical protein ACREJD_09285 [Phycisphaerales bacterium]
MGRAGEECGNFRWQNDVQEFATKQAVHCMIGQRADCGTPLALICDGATTLIRITKQEVAGPGVVFRVEGTLDAEAVKEFRSIIDSSGVQAPFAIDVSGVTSIRPEGSSLLKELSQRGCRLSGGSMYINRLLGVVES